jgi:hypothetical protein
MRFLRAGAGYRVTDHEHNGDITRELWITDIKTTVKYYQKQLLEPLERMPENRIIVLLRVL